MKNSEQHTESQKNNSQKIHKMESVPTPNRDQNEARPTTEAALHSTDGGMEFGDMNLEDAKESGYTDEQGRAVDMAQPDTDEESPTGALTDVGSGRSSVVKKKSEVEKPRQNS